MEGERMKTKVSIYVNKRNENKFLEIHNDGHYHNSVKQFMCWTNVRNDTGDGCLHRWHKGNLTELLEDYRLVSKEM